MQKGSCQIQWALGLKGSLLPGPSQPGVGHPHTQDLLLLSPKDTAAAGSQPLSSPFSPFYQAPSSSALTPASLHCNCHPNKHPAPNYFFSISSGLAVSAPKFGISDIVTKVNIALPSATAKLRRLCWPCKITPFKSFPIAPVPLSVKLYCLSHYLPVKYSRPSQHCLYLLHYLTLLCAMSSNFSHHAKLFPRACSFS